MKFFPTLLIAASAGSALAQFDVVDFDAEDGGLRGDRDLKKKTKAVIERIQLKCAAFTGAYEACVVRNGGEGSARHTFWKENNLEGSYFNQGTSSTAQEKNPDNRITDPADFGYNSVPCQMLKTGECVGAPCNYLNNGKCDRKHTNDICEFRMDKEDGKGFFGCYTNLCYQHSNPMNPNAGEAACNNQEGCKWSGKKCKPTTKAPKSVCYPFDVDSLWKSQIVIEDIVYDPKEPACQCAATSWACKGKRLETSEGTSSQAVTYMTF